MSEKAPIRVLVTGAAGQIAYSLVLLIGKGDVFGEDQPIILHLLDIPPMAGVLEGVKMEVKDCAFKNVRDVITFVREDDSFKDVDAVFLVGAMPRKDGMERRDLLTANVKIFKSQGRALDQHAKKTCKVLVVGNPANTNAMICAYYAPTIPKENFSAMTRLDQNRAQAELAEKLNVPVDSVDSVIIWGNHSNTQFPDASIATYIKDDNTENVKATLDSIYLNNEFITKIQKRGAEVINARKLSSAMSAAKAASDHMRDWWFGTGDRIVSMAVYSNNNPYNIDNDIFFSFPVTVGEDRKWTIREGIDFSDAAQQKINETRNELVEEKDQALSVCRESE